MSTDYISLCADHSERIAALEATQQQQQQSEPIDEKENARRFRTCMAAIDAATPEQIRAATPEATQEDPQTLHSVAPPIGPEWKPCVKLPITVHVREQRPGETHVSTREGITPVRPDDLIMLGVQGEEYPIGRELFNQTYRMGEAAELRAPAPAGGLVEQVAEHIVDAMVTSDQEAACAAILAVAEWLDTRGQHGCSLWLREEVQRHG